MTRAAGTVCGVEPVVHTNDRCVAGSTGNIFEDIAPELAEPRNRAVAQVQRPGTRAIFILGFVDPNESFRIREGQRAQEHAFDDREDRGICTDPQRERQNRDQSELRAI